MRYASLTKLGGELIEADRADYDDYKGFLRCPECGEPVFLRKSHTRQSAQRVSAVGGTAIAVPSQLITVPSAFVHHQAVPEVSVCELRVGSYTEAEVEYRRSVSRDQRLKKLQVSMWKYLKTNLFFSLNNYYLFAKRFKKDVLYQNLVQKITSDIDRAERQDEIINEFFPFVAKDMHSFWIDYYPKTINNNEQQLYQFLNKRRRDWSLHCLLAREALDFTLRDKAMESVRYRLLCCFLDDSCIKQGIKFIEHENVVEEIRHQPDEWKIVLDQYICKCFTTVFLMVDWMEIFNTEGCW